MAALLLARLAKSSMGIWWINNVIGTFLLQRYLNMGTWSSKAAGCNWEETSLARRLKQPAVLPKAPLELFR